MIKALEKVSKNKPCVTKERNLVKPMAPGTNSVRRKWTAIQQVLQQSCDKSDVDKSLKESLPNGQIPARTSQNDELAPAETAGM